MRMDSWIVRRTGGARPGTRFCRCRAGAHNPDERGRFAAAHGQRALLMGYSGMGLEAWTYPFQLFRSYRIQLLLGSERVFFSRE
jgi:hypothetical protein